MVARNSSSCAIASFRTGSTAPFVPYTALSPQSVADFEMIAFLRAELDILESGVCTYE